MKFSLAGARNVAGLILGLMGGWVITSPVVSASGLLPALSLASPTDGSNVSGTVTFLAVADSAGLTSLQFKIDGVNYGPKITAGSCKVMFATTSVTDGPHTVQAYAESEFGSTVISQPATMFVNNLAPAIAGISVAVTASSATISWSTAIPADSQVQYGLTPSYGSTSPKDWAMVQNHSLTITGLSASTPYHFRAHSMAESGIMSSSGDFVFVTAAAGSSPTPTPTPPTPGTPPTTPTPTPTPGPTPTPTPTPTPSQPTKSTGFIGTSSAKAVAGSPSAKGETSTGVLPPASPTRKSTVVPGSPAKSSTQSTSAPPAGPVRVSTSRSTRAVVGVPCTQPDPFAKEGGLGICVNGEWVQLWKPTAKTIATTRRDKR